MNASTARAGLITNTRFTELTGPGAPAPEPPPQLACGGGGDDRTGAPFTVVTDNGDGSSRVFNELVDAVIPGWSIIEADYARHVAWGLLVAGNGGHVAVLTHSPKRSLVRLQVRLETTGMISVSHLPVLFRIQERVWMTRIIPNLDDAAAILTVGSPCPEGFAARRILALMVGDLRQVLDDDRLAVIGMSNSTAGRDEIEGGVQ